MQISSLRIILKNRFDNYENALMLLHLDTLVDRRNQLCKNANQSVKDKSIIFELNDKLHAMEARNSNKYKIKHCNTERLKMSALPQIQRMLNEP